MAPPLTPNSPGRKDPTDGKLQHAQLLLSIGLKKNWAQRSPTRTSLPSYWVELYGKKDPKSDYAGIGTNKYIQFYVYRQWSFFRGSMFDSSRELVEGYTLEDHFIIGIVTAGEKLLELVTAQVKNKSYQICEISKTSEGDAHFHDSLATIEDGLAALAGIVPDQFSVDAPRKKEDFWSTARQREKKSRW